MGNCFGGGSRLEETSGAQDGPQARSKPGMHGQAVEETMVERVISRFSTTAENSLASKLPDENTTEAEQTEAEDKVDEDGIGLTQQTLVDKSPLTAPNRSFKLAGTGSMGAGGKPMAIERQSRWVQLHALHMQQQHAQASMKHRAFITCVRTWVHIGPIHVQPLLHHSQDQGCAAGLRRRRGAWSWPGEVRQHRAGHS